MNSLEKRLSKIESKVLIKKDHGVFIILIDNGTYNIINRDDATFNSLEELENYIYTHYDSDKYVFITFDVSNIKKG